MSTITDVDVRMYGTGTGDCFVLKFFTKKEVAYTMMIDGGTWKGTSAHLSKYVKDLKKYVNNKVDLLVITHEHKDHVYLFDACANLFTANFDVGEIWMAWSENDNDPEVEKWKKDFGQKKRALSISGDLVKKAFDASKLDNQFNRSRNGTETKNEYINFKSAFDDFLDLHFSAREGDYKGGLKGMEIIKNEIATGNIRYLKPGQIESIDALPGVNFNILGPPESIKAIRKEHGKKGNNDTYDHNKVLKKSDSFSYAVDLKTNSELSLAGSEIADNVKARAYYSNEHTWRGIDQDWLMVGAGNLALRLTSGINNLSLAMAIEFTGSGKVLLFPGDAEFGSWESWHTINWGKKGKNDKHFTEDLLNRTVFYKVAHHLSHNGTAKEKGLEMMTSKDLVSMATLDFDAISSNWKSTMPNRGILKDLITKTKGRLIIMNEDDLYYDFDENERLKDKIEKERGQLSNEEKIAFDKNFTKKDFYKQYRIDIQ